MAGPDPVQAGRPARGPADDALLGNDPNRLLDRQRAFGYTQEDLQFFLGLAQTARIPSARWAATSIAVLSARGCLTVRRTACSPTQVLITKSFVDDSSMVFAPSVG